MANAKKPYLPKSVLDMKFMKKTKDRIERELENTHGHNTLYSNIITNEMRHASGNYVSESSFMYCEDLMEGRLSFKGMNPEIERLMELEAKPSVDSDMQKDVSDEILVKKMEAFNKRKKAQNTTPNKYPASKKKKFV